MKKYALFGLTLLTLLGCQAEKASPPLFELLTPEQTGLSFSNDLNESPDWNILEYLYFYNGAGVATADFNNDGLTDIYFVANQQPNQLYLNKGNFQFEDITAKAGVAGTGTWATGVTVADVNGDGYKDIYLSQVGDYKEAKGANQLFINNGDLTFTESAAAYGLDFVGFSTQAAFFDYDRDGDLDMYLMNHSIKSPAVFSQSETRIEIDEKGGDRLYQSQMAEGNQAFVDVTQAAGIYSSSLGFGLGLAVSDLNNDGWLDLYISNDFTENDYLYINNQDGSFSEQLEKQVAYTSRYSMGNIAADLDNDGLSEVITTDMLPSDPEIWQKSVGEDKVEVFDVKLNFGYAHQYVRNTLQKNLGNGTFSDVSLMAGMYATDWSWAPLAFDMDNDGLVDLHISNGIYKRPNDLDYVNYGQDQRGVKQMTADELEAFQIENLPNVKIPNYAGKNLGGLKFEPVADRWGLGQASYSNGSSYADFDNDGDLDLVVNNTNQGAFVYQNKANEHTENKSLTVRLEGPKGNKFAIGAKVMLSTEEAEMTREVMPTRGFQSAVGTDVVFGLGKAKVKELKVRWPDGHLQTLRGGPNEGVFSIKYEASVQTTLKATEPDLINASVSVFEGYKHKENLEFKDYNREYLIPRKYSTEGPALAMADVNGDGLKDMYLGGAKGQPGSLWLQNDNGSFRKIENQTFDMLARAEDTDALFFDANGDGTQDLYVVSAGNEYNEGQVFTYDRIYFNDGQGRLRFAPGALPQFGTHGKKVTSADVDGDGDLDLFIAANIVSGAYGVNPQHHLLINNGRGQFTDATAQLMPEANTLGMLNDALWLDHDQDGDQDLLVAGEWTALTILENDGQGRFSKAEVSGLEGTNGWWMSLEAADLDGDGDLDIVAGNLGLNTKLKASAEKPLNLYVNDFDQNGQTDPVLFHYIGDSHIPFATRDDLIKQMAFLKKKHANYTEYSQVKKPSDLFDRAQLASSLKKEINQLATVVFINEGGSYRREQLPLVAQLSPVMDIEIADLNADGFQDLLLVGNFHGFRNDIGRASAKPVTLLLGSATGEFSEAAASKLNTQQSWGEYRKTERINSNSVLLLRNDDHPLIITFSK